MILIETKFKATLDSAGEVIVGEKVLDEHHPKVVAERALTKEEKALSIGDLAIRIGQINKKALLIAKKSLKATGNRYTIVNIITIENEGN